MFSLCYAQVAEEGWRPDLSASTYSLYILLGQLHVVPDSSAVQHAALKLSLFACHASMTLSYHVQALDFQQNEFNLRLEAMTTIADNDRAALVEAQRSVTHWHICHLLLLLAWSVCCLHSLARHL